MEGLCKGLGQTRRVGCVCLHGVGCVCTCEWYTCGLVSVQYDVMYLHVGCVCLCAACVSMRVMSVSVCVIYTCDVHVCVVCVCVRVFV